MDGCGVVVVVDGGGVVVVVVVGGFCGCGGCGGLLRLCGESGYG